MRRLRICYTLNTFDLGGAETVALDLARHHDAAAHDVVVAALIEPKRQAEPAMRARFRAAGVRTHAIVQPSYRSPLALARIFAFLARGSFDVVHGHNRGADYWGARLAKLAGVRTVSWTRHLIYDDMPIKQARRYRELVRGGAGVVAVSEAVKGACREFEGIDPESVTTITNGIDLLRFRAIERDERVRIRAALNVAPDDRLLLFVARFAEAKAPGVFVELVRRLRLRDPRVRGFMCGYGPLDAEVRRLADITGGAVAVLGLRSDVPQLLGACDLFVSTSRNEGLPLNLMEAMAAGAPFVAPDIAPIRELVAGHLPLERQLAPVLPVRDADLGHALASWESLICDTLGDAPRREAIGVLGREVMRAEYSVDRMVRRYEEYFRQRIAARS